MKVIYNSMVMDEAAAKTMAKRETELGKFFDNDEDPSQLDIIEAQLAYSAMMTDTLLEV